MADSRGGFGPALERRTGCALWKRDRGDLVALPHQEFSAKGQNRSMRGAASGAVRCPPLWNQFPCCASAILLFLTCRLAIAVGQPCAGCPPRTDADRTGAR